MSHDRRIDHRLRLAAAVGASASIAVTQDPASLALLLAAALGAGVLAVALGEARPEALLRRLLAVNAFLVLVWLTLPWEFAVGGLRRSEAGLQMAWSITLRANAIAAACLALLAGMDGVQLARSAAALGLPAGLVQLLALTVRYIELIGVTRQRLERAMRARGYRPRADLRTVRVTAQLVALLLVHALVRAERVELALRARGFAGRGIALAPRAGWDGLPRPHWAWAAGTAAVLVAAWTLPVLAR